MRYNSELKAAIKNKKMTQASLADKINMDPAILSHVVNGRWLLQKEEKEAIANALGVEVSEIFVVGNK